MHGATYAVPTKVGVDHIARRARDLTDGVGDIAQAVACSSLLNSCVKGRLAGVDKSRVRGGGVSAHHQREG